LHHAQSLAPGAVADGAFMQRLTITHVRRWHLYRESVGMGHIYQGPYKSFPIQCDEHFLTVCRYVERNPLRASLVPRAEDWRWSSLAAWASGGSNGCDLVLTEWPLPRPNCWTDFVNQPQSEAELAALRASVMRRRPYGSGEWQLRTAKALGLGYTLKMRGRPRKRG
jgi:putative transposase